MRTRGLVSVVIATFKRPELLRRAITSVRAQSYLPIEIVVVHDGPYHPDYHPEAYDLRLNSRDWFVSTLWHFGDWGAGPRRYGTELARGDYIAYLDDDNVYLPNHLQSLVRLIESTHSDFVFSDDNRHIGNGQPQFGHIDTSTILHRKELLEKAQWRTSGYAADWDLVERWLEAGASWAYSGQPTLTYNPRNT